MTVPWFRVDDNFYDHPKVDDLSLGAVGLWTLCGTYCAKQLTDGFIPSRRVMKMGGTEGVIQELIHSGLWLVVEGGYQFHDWDAYQPTREKVERDREAARERQAKKRRGDNGQYSSELPEKSARSHGVTSQELPKESPRESHHPVPSLPFPTLPLEEEAPDSGESEATPREDVQEVIDHMVAALKANDVRRYKVGKPWYDAARLMIDKDGYTVEQIKWITDWSANDSFWRSNIHSMPKLREQFDRLKIQAMSEREGKATTTDQRRADNVRRISQHQPWTPEQASASQWGEEGVRALGR